MVCPFRRVTGLPCPGCGISRGVAYLALGEPRAAVRSHPLSPLFAIGAIVIGAARLAGMQDLSLIHI